MGQLTTFWRKRKYMEPCMERLDMLFRFVEDVDLEISTQIREAFITVNALQQFTDANSFVTDIADEHIPHARKVMGAICRATHRIHVFTEYMKKYDIIGTIYLLKRLQATSTLVNHHNSTQVIGLMWKEGVTTKNCLFVLNVVDEASPHDLLHTVVVKQSRIWWCPWRKEITYQVLVRKRA